MKPITELYFAQNDILSDESWFWFSDSKKETFIMYSEEEFRENAIIQPTNVGDIQNYGIFLLQRSFYTLETQREYEKIDSILSYMGGFIQMVFVITGFVMEFYNMQSLMLQLANQLYSFETPTELTHDDKDINNFGTRQEFLQSIFKKIFLKVKQLALKPSYFIYRLSFKKILKNDTNTLIHQAMKQVDKDLNIFEILDRLHEVDKMKKVLFTEEQKKIFEFSYKPTINLESIYKNMRIQKIQKLEKQKMQKKKMKQSQLEKRMQKKYKYEKKTSIKEKIQQSLTNQIEISKQSQLLNQDMQYKQDKQRQKSRQDFCDIVQQIAYFKNEKNIERVKQISHLLIEEGFYQQGYNQNVTMNNIPNTKAFIAYQSNIDEKISHQPLFYSKTELQSNQNFSILQGNQNNTVGQIQLNNSLIGYTPLQQFLKQSKSKKCDNLLLNLIKELRPQTFYSERMDYSNISAFYELYEAYQISLDSQQNSRSSIKTTKKIIQFLGQDIRDVFKSAVRLPDEGELRKQERIRLLVIQFINNIKKRIGKPTIIKIIDDDHVNTKIQDLTMNYLFKFNNMNTLNEKSDIYIKQKNNQSLTNLSQYSSQIQHSESNQLVNNDTSPINNLRFDDKSQGILSNPANELSEGQQSIQYSPIINLNQKTTTKQISFEKKARKVSILEISDNNQNNSINSKNNSIHNKNSNYINNKRRSLQLHINNDKSYFTSPINQQNNKNAGVSIFRQSHQQSKVQAKTINELPQILGNSSEESSQSVSSQSNSKIKEESIFPKLDELINRNKSEINYNQIPVWQNQILTSKKTTD